MAKDDVVYQMSDVRKHDTEDDCWLVIEGVVYDVTDFLPEHPGGGDIVVDVAGTWVLMRARSSGRQRQRACVFSGTTHLFFSE